MKDEFGCWRVRGTVIEFRRERHWYEVDLHRCRTSAQVLDWLCQVSQKKWATSEDVGDLVHALEWVLAPQATLCSGGVERGQP